MKLAIASGATLMLVSTLSFADPSQGVLPVGHPAGIRQAQQGEDRTLYILTGLVVLGLLIGVGASAGSSSPSGTAPPVPTQH